MRRVKREQEKERREEKVEAGKKSLENKKFNNKSNISPILLALLENKKIHSDSLSRTGDIFEFINFLRFQQAGRFLLPFFFHDLDVPIRFVQ